MSNTQAIKLAIATIHQKVKALAFDANLYVQYGARTHVPTRAYKERERLKQAIGILEKSIDNAR